MPYTSDPELTDALRKVRAALDIGRQLSYGDQRVQITGQQRALQSTQTGRFVTQAAILADYAKNQKRAVLERLANHVKDLLEANIEELTGYHLFTLAYLRHLGHPYARRHPGGKGWGIPFPAKYVSVQGKKPGQVLSQNFHYSVTQQPGGVFGIMVANPVAHSAFLADGTSKMIARPYDLAAVRMTTQQSGKLIDGAIHELEALGIDHSDIRVPVIQSDFDGRKKVYNV